MARVRSDRFVARMCQESYYQFFLEHWSLIAAETLVNSWYIQRLCEELQRIAERVFLDKPKEYDFLWNCPPGTSKSSLVSILWQPWLWTRMPSLRFISGSYSERLALDLSRKSRDVVSSDKYRALFPFIKMRDDQNTKSHFANTEGGMRYAVGVGGTVIGMHAHVIAIDDPIDPQAALSDLMLAEANTWMTETLSRRKVNVMLTPTVCIMQRLHQDDPSGNMLNRGTPLRHCCVPGDDGWEIKPAEFREKYSETGLLDPIRLPREALEDALATLGEVGYAGQYGQSPVPRGGAMFKIDRLQYSPEAPKQWRRFPRRYWDKAATAAGGAWTAGVKIGMDLEKRIWILDVVRGQWDSDTRERVILKTARADGRKVLICVEQEPGGSGKDSAEDTAKSLTLAGFHCRLDKVTGDKELRADPLSVQVNAGNVTLQNGPWNNTFVEEMRYFPRSKYKDQIDAASGCFNQLARSRLRIGVL